MRLIFQTWMLLALLMIHRNVVKAQADSGEIYISGDGDDEDYVTDAPGEIAEGSGTTEGMALNPKAAAVMPKFDNTIRILKIGTKNAKFIPEHNDPNSPESQEVFATVCEVVLASLRENEVTRGVNECVGVSITQGSLVVKTEVTFSEDTVIVPSDVESAIRSSLEGRTLATGTTSFTVDTDSIVVATASSETVPNVPTEKMPEKPTNGKPDKPNSTPDVMPTTMRPNKGRTDNDVFFDTSPPMKPAKSTTISNMIDVVVNEEDRNNKLEVKDEKENQNFFEMILSSPALLAAMVGAVVLTLITIVLITMFLIYRVKKKDEGSYSLDEPHKVKDPTAYWKDTKEFYA